MTTMSTTTTTRLDALLLDAIQESVQCGTTAHLKIDIEGVDSGDVLTALDALQDADDTLEIDHCMLDREGVATMDVWAGRPGEDVMLWRLAIAFVAE